MFYGDVLVAYEYAGSAGHCLPFCVKLGASRVKLINEHISKRQERSAGPNSSRWMAIHFSILARHFCDQLFLVPVFIARKFS